MFLNPNQYYKASLNLSSNYLLFLIPAKVSLISFHRSKYLLLVSTPILVSTTKTLLNLYFGRIKSIIKTLENPSKSKAHSVILLKVIPLHHSINLGRLKSRLQTDNVLIRINQ